MWPPSVVTQTQPWQCSRKAFLSTCPTRSASARALPFMLCLVCSRAGLTLIYPPFFTPVRNHRGGVKLPPGVSPFLEHVRKKLQRLYPCIGGKTFLRCKPLCSGSCSVPEVAIAEAETGNYNICGHRRATLEIPMSISTFLSTSCSMATKSI